MKFSLVVLGLLVVGSAHWPHSQLSGRLAAQVPEDSTLAGRHRMVEDQIKARGIKDTAVLGELAREVYTIEIVPQLADRARSTLAVLGYRNVHVRTGDGYLGWPEQAPFDAIMVTAAPDHVPQPLVDQLAVSGRMIIPVG